MEHLKIKTEHKRALSVSDNAMSAYKRCWLVSAKSFDSLTSIWNDENYLTHMELAYIKRVMMYMRVWKRQRHKSFCDKNIRLLFISIAILQNSWYVFVCLRNVKS